MQKNYAFYYDHAFPGKFEGGPFPTARIQAYGNSAASKKDTWTVTVPTPDSAVTNYTIRVAKAGEPNVDATAVGATSSALAANLVTALQVSGAYDYADVSLAGSVITIKARLTGVPIVVTSPTNATTTADLVIANTVPGSSSGDIPFGRVVVRGTGDLVGTCRLPIINTGNVVLGVTVAQMVASERNALGPQAKTVYPADVAVDVVDRIGSALGIWVEATSDIVVGDTVYIDCVNASLLGSLTKISTSNLLLPAGMKVVEKSSKNGINNATYSVLLDVTL
jgi:hypothetical protein